MFRKSAYVLWSNLGETSEAINAQVVSNLLNRLHSRKASDSSSDVEEVIVHDLTSMDKVSRPTITLLHPVTHYSSQVDQQQRSSVYCGH